MVTTRKLLIKGLAVLLLVSGCSKHDEIWTVNSSQLSHALSELNQTEENVEELIPFEWDEAYSFTPYLQKEFIYDIIGYKWDNIKESTSEDMIQVVFMYQGKVVCHIFGRVEKLGFVIDFGDYNGNDYVKITKDESAKLHFECEGDKKILRYN